jgi:tryptophan-rich hypothetical protein
MQHENTATPRPAPNTAAHAQPHPLQVSKLLRSKWSAAVPVNKEKHFIVTALIAPEAPGTHVDTVTMEAVLTGRTFTLRWRELNDTTQWVRGWA